MSTLKSIFIHQKILKKMSIVILIIFTQNMISCKKENWCDCVKNTGKIIKEERTVSPFTEVELYNNVNLFIKQDSIFKISVEAGNHLISLIETSVTNNKLTIKNHNKCNWVRSYEKPINVSISVKNINHIIYYGSGNITSTNTLTGSDLNVESFYGGSSINLSVNVETIHSAIHTGPADLNISGYATISYVYCAGNGFIRFDNLYTNDTYLENKGTGNCYVWVNSTFVAELHYIGDVYYKGDPHSITTDITGTGRLIKN